MLDKKQIPVIFLLEFKMGCKAVETTHNISSTFGPGTANEQTYSAVVVQEVLQRRALKMSVVASHRKLTMTNWEQSLKLILLTAAWEAAEDFNDHFTVIWHLKQTGKVKKLNKWLSNEWVSKVAQSCPTLRPHGL